VLLAARFRRSNIETAVLSGAWYSEATSFPHGFDPEAYGMREHPDSIAAREARQARRGEPQHITDSDGGKMVGQAALGALRGCSCVLAVTKVLAGTAAALLGLFGLFVGVRSILKDPSLIASNLSSVLAILFCVLVPILLVVLAVRIAKRRQRN
jgi:hypothetical protein